MAYLGSKVTFTCSAADFSQPVTYQLLKRMPPSTSPIHPLHKKSPATFFFKVSPATEGTYQCMATAGGNTTASNSIRLILMRTRINSEPDPAVLYEGSRLVLSCDVTVGAQLSYTWFFNRTKVMPSTSTWLRPTSSKLAVERVTVLHAGVYSCMTQDWLNENRSSSSQVMQVHVKVHLSQPRIAFSISKEADGYGGHVTCWTSRGSPPATFYLLLDGKEVTSVEATKSTLAKFPVAMVPGQDMGMAECLVKNEVQELKSRSLTLVVVLVGGHVQVEVEYLYGADSKMAAAQLHCLPSQGTFPSFSWLLNNSSLPVKADPWTHGESWSPRYAFVDGGRVLVLTKTRGGESGSYRCRVRDSFDDSSAWFESPDVQVRMIETTLTTIEIISISFCCFLLLILVSGSVWVTAARMNFCCQPSLTAQRKV